MYHLKKLATQTAIYGVSSILGRIINYFLVAIHTSIFLKNELGIVSYLYGYIALILISITFGMETTFFRFATKNDKPTTYNLASTVVILASLLFAIFLFTSAPFLSEFLSIKFNWEVNTNMIRWLASIIFIDGATAIPFAKLRIENRPIKFATTKIIAILANIIIQLFLLVVLPAIHNQDYLSYLKPLVDTFYNPNFGIEYIFLANLLSNLLLCLLLSKEFLQIRFSLNWVLLKPMLIYAVPILITGFTGWIINDFDKIAISEWSKGGLSDQGVYSQTYKLGVIMMLAIQAFRYAVEPFFFSQEKNKQAPILFAKTMHYYYLLALAIILVICMHIDLVALLLLRNPEYRVALFLVPIIMLGKLLFGVYINLSIWFKLKDKTNYGILFTGIGAIITLAGNYFFLGIYGYIASAITIVVTYFIMSLLCYYIGKSQFPIPYNFKPLFLYTFIVMISIFLSYQIKLDNLWFDNLLNFSISIVCISIIYRIERNRVFTPIE